MNIHIKYVDLYINKNIHVVIENFIFKVGYTELFISVTIIIIELFLRRDLSFADEKNTLVTLFVLVVRMGKTSLNSLVRREITSFIFSK